MKNKIKKYENKSLSNYNIFELLNKKIRILTYPELAEYKNIYDVLSPNNSFILLYMTGKRYGHWCCVIEHNDRIEFFDPYGDALPDDEFKYIDNNFRKISSQYYPHLTYLLYKSKKPIEYNNYNFQKKNNNIKTCGRHCVFRIANKKLLLDEYKKMLDYIRKETDMTYDEIVTYYTIKKK